MNETPSNMATIVIKLRRTTGLPILECKRFAEQTDCDFDKAYRLARGLPMNKTSEELEAEEYDRLDNLPFYSKEPGDDYYVDITCPHCNKDFYCRGFGAGGRAENDN